jgi:hypothetical protein
MLCVVSEMERFTSWHFQGPADQTSSGAAKLEAGSFLPSVLSAVEMAVMQILAQVMEMPLSVTAASLCPRKSQQPRDVLTAASLCPHKVSSKEDKTIASVAAAHSHVYLNALLTRTENPSLAEGRCRRQHHLTAQSAVGSRKRCMVVKVKVGGDAPVAEQAARVRSLAEEAVRQKQRLRLDANKCWTLPEVCIPPHMHRRGVHTSTHTQVRTRACVRIARTPSARAQSTYTHAPWCARAHSTYILAVLVLLNLSPRTIVLHQRWRGVGLALIPAWVLASRLLLSRKHWARRRGVSSTTSKSRYGIAASSLPFVS